MYFTMNESKCVVARCNAGLGNRILNLVGATYLARALNARLHVLWTPTEICDCNFSDIFINDSLVLGDNLFNTHSYYMNLKNTNSFDASVVDTKIPMSGEKYRCINYRPYAVDINDLRQYQCILYQSSALLPQITPSDVIDILSAYKIKQDIMQEVMCFISENNITESVLGYHVRLTDSFKNINRSRAEDVINDICKNPSMRYFVCSCDREFEKHINSYSNVICRKKSSYPVFIKSESDLNRCSQSARIRECNTESKFPFNYVDTNAVKDAFIDMLILSRTNIIKQYPLTSNFRVLASFYSDVFFGKTFLKYNNKVIKIAE